MQTDLRAGVLACVSLLLVGCGSEDDDTKLKFSVQQDADVIVHPAVRANSHHGDSYTTVKLTNFITHKPVL